MGIAQIALDPPLCQTGKREKIKCPKPSWQALTPLGNVGKKCPKPSWQSFTPPPPLPPLQAMPIAHMETTRFTRIFPNSHLATLSSSSFRSFIFRSKSGNFLSILSSRDPIILRQRIGIKSFRSNLYLNSPFTRFRVWSTSPSMLAIFLLLIHRE